MVKYFLDYLILFFDLMNITHPVLSNSGLFTILTFHRVLPNNLKQSYPLPNLVVTPEELYFILDHCKKYFLCGTVSQMLKIWRNGRSNKPILAITFDDGQLDNFAYALPVLNKLGLKATFYIPVSNLLSSTLLWHDILGFFILDLYQRKSEPEIISHFLKLKINFDDSPFFSAKKSILRAKNLSDYDRNKMIAEITSLNHFIQPKWAGMMTLEHLKKLLHMDHEIGSHSMTHPLLDKCSNDVINDEVITSKIYLSKKLNNEIESFSFPNGNFNQYILDIVQKAGYKNAVTTQLISNRLNHSNFELGRFDILSSRIRMRHGNRYLSKQWLNYRLSGLMRFINTKRSFNHVY